MALLWIEGFEGFGTTTGVDLTAPVSTKYMMRVMDPAWAHCPPMLTTGQFGGYGLCTPDPYVITGHGNPNISLMRPVSVSGSTVVAGAALKFVGESDSAKLVFYNGTSGLTVYLLGAGDVEHCVWVMQANNLRSGDAENWWNSGIRAQSQPLNLTDGNWYYLEVKIYTHPTAGSIEVRLDGVTVLNLTNVDTVFGGSNQITQFGVGLFAVWYREYAATAIDNVYLLDTSGSSHTDFLGPVFVKAIAPNGDGAVAWAPSTPGTHYSLVNENPVTTTAYVTSSVVDTLDLYNYSDLVGVTVCYGAQVNTTCRCGGPAQLKSPVVSSGVQDDGTATLLVAGNEHVASRISETDPATGQLWQPTALNSAQFGVKVG